MIRPAPEYFYFQVGKFELIYNYQFVPSGAVPFKSSQPKLECCYTPLPAPQTNRSPGYAQATDKINFSHLRWKFTLVSLIHLTFSAKYRLLLLLFSRK